MNHYEHYNDVARPIEEYDNTLPEATIGQGYTAFLWSSPSFRRVFIGTGIPLLLALGLGITAIADQNHTGGGVTIPLSNNEP